MNKLYTLFIKKIWKDDVWSGVISTGIVMLIGYVASNIDSRIKASLIKILSLKIELWIVLLVVAFVGIVFGLSTRRRHYDEKSITVDRDLFNKIRNDLEMTSLMAKVKVHSFSNAPIEIEQLTKLLSLLDENNKADFEFLNPTLNKLKENLIDELQLFELSASRYLFGVKGMPGWTAIPSEWESEQPERMQEAFTALQRNENRLAEAYQKFISEGRAILKG